MKWNSFRLGIHNLAFISISGLGGFLLSLTGLSIGWMVGTLISAGALSLWRPKRIALLQRKNGIESYWLKIGQLMLGIQLGQQINLTVFRIFGQNWVTMTGMILASIVIALITGLMLFRFSKTDLVTSLYGTTPGGLSSMIGIAADVGANTAVVGIIQTMRVILVVSTLPLAVSLWGGEGGGETVSELAPPLTQSSCAGLLAVSAMALFGCFISKAARLPAPWLIGSMMGVGAAQVLSDLAFGHDLAVWWPNGLIIIAQLMIGASVGSKLNRAMFAGLARAAVIGVLGSLGLMAAMVVCSLVVSRLTRINAVTSILAFSPGGIAEMAATSVVLHADSTFVVAVQVLRVLAICLFLPPFFRLMGKLAADKKTSASRAG
ncbi:AbrB family transcriptional regulator [Sporolactobacillus sp. THM7-7]|nr:AbrB family transcriptional regulator [Sporolactobacillus sp. THM7-7]